MYGVSVSKGYWGECSGLTHRIRVCKGDGANNIKRSFIIYILCNILLWLYNKCGRDGRGMTAMRNIYHENVKE
jgi:hypothetical protein